MNLVKGIYPSEILYIPKKTPARCKCGLYGALYTVQYVWCEPTDDAKSLMGMLVGL